MAQRWCPQCGETLKREQRETGGATVAADVCPSGDGVFLDEGEIDQLTRGRELASLLRDELGRDEGAPRLECPNCKEIMATEVLELEDEDAEIDVCTVCSGIWLSREELSGLQGVEGADRSFNEDEMAEIWDDGLPPLQRRERLGSLLATVSTDEESGSGS